MKCYTVLIFYIISFTCFSQYQINGVVKDKKGVPVFAANVFLKSKPEKGTTTDFDGNFKVETETLIDTLIISFIGYETKKISLSSVDIDKKIIVLLNETNQTL